MIKYLRLFSVACGLLLVSGIGIAQEPVPSTGQNQQVTSKSAATQQIEDRAAARAEALESLRYRHLWIAYALIWFMVFWFIFRTHRLANQGQASIDSLKEKLLSLERKDG